MNILVLGGIQASGPGLPSGKSYMAQFIRRLKTPRQPVQVDYYCVGLADAVDLIPQLQLAHYDLILVEIAPDLAWLPTSTGRRLLLRGKLAMRGHRLNSLKTMRRQLATLLLQVRVVHQQVVMLSPFPREKGLERQVIRQINSIWEQECRDLHIPYFNLDQHLQGGDELFLPDSPRRLSAVAHELVGSELHAFITEPTYTVWF